MVVVIFKLGPKRQVIHQLYGVPKNVRIGEPRDREQDFHGKRVSWI